MSVCLAERRQCKWGLVSRGMGQRCHYIKVLRIMGARFLTVGERSYINGEKRELERTPDVGLELEA